MKERAEDGGIHAGTEMEGDDKMFIVDVTPVGKEPVNRQVTGRWGRL